MTSTGRFGVLPVTGSPVSGQSAASLVPPETGWESGFLALDLSSPPPQAASVRLSDEGRRGSGDSSGLAEDRVTDMRASMTKRALRFRAGPAHVDE